MILLRAWNWKLSIRKRACDRALSQVPKHDLRGQILNNYNSREREKGIIGSKKPEVMKTGLKWSWWWWWRPSSVFSVGKRENEGQKEAGEEACDRVLAEEAENLEFPAPQRKQHSLGTQDLWETMSPAQQISTPHNPKKGALLSSNNLSVITGLKPKFVLLWARRRN